MKYPTSKNVTAARELTSLARARASKVQAQLDELGARSWKGGEIEMQRLASSARKAVTEANRLMAQAEEDLAALAAVCERKGK